MLRRRITFSSIPRISTRAGMASSGSIRGGCHVRRGRRPRRRLILPVLALVSMVMIVPIPTPIRMEPTRSPHCGASHSARPRHRVKVVHQWRRIHRRHSRVAHPRSPFAGSTVRGSRRPLRERIKVIRKLRRRRRRMRSLDELGRAWVACGSRKNVVFSRVLECGVIVHGPQRRR